MTTIRFENENAHVLYHDMVASMWENARDDHVSAAGEPGPSAGQLDRVIIATPGDQNSKYPAVFDLPDDIVPFARDVLENLLDVREGWQTHDDDAADEEDPDRSYILDNEITIAP